MSAKKSIPPKKGRNDNGTVTPPLDGTELICLF